MSSEVGIAETLRRALDEMGPAEKQVARALLADYPVAGLEPAKQLASRVGVSSPTVLRTVKRVGFGSYPSFQAALRAEVTKRTLSPLAQYTRLESVSEGGSKQCEQADSYSRGWNTTADFLADAQRTYLDALKASFAGISVTDFTETVRCLADTAHPVWVVGGRYSVAAAQYLSTHLRLLRSGVRMVPAGSAERALALLDIDESDSVVVFDYRRYTPALAQFAQAAKAKRAKVLLFTDPWLSPVAKSAEAVVTSSVTAPSPFDSLAHAITVTEVVIARVAQLLGGEPLDRIVAFDEATGHSIESTEPVPNNEVGEEK